MDKPLGVRKNRSIRDNTWAMFVRVFLIGLVLAVLDAPLAHAWEPVGGKLTTPWAEEVNPESPLPEYPRPQMRRDNWKSLNGLWSYAITDRGGTEPKQSGEILVPFPVESALSGVGATVTPDDALWYVRDFTVPAGWGADRLLLHFGAVDWEADVWVNGTYLGEHRGGYTPFSFDITEAVHPTGDQQLVVRVWDPTDSGTQARGKQRLDPQGIWYTPVTGIWQTVWIEPVPNVSLKGVVPTPDIENEDLTVAVELRGSGQGLELRAIARDGRTEIAREDAEPGSPISLAVREPKLWSPDSPYLYDLTVQLLKDGEVIDEIESYFGMRKIALGKDRRGQTRLMLNNEVLFHMGPLDQGWWPDGLYTAPTDAALRFDIEATRTLGFNMARKHVKVEPARWYYHADRLGLIVWQDMPSGFLPRGRPNSLFVDAFAKDDAFREGVSAAQFENELKEMIDAFRFFPSILMWVPFNEGWGQYDTARIAGWIKNYDPSRLVNAASGWTDRGAGDVYDTHMYPGPGMAQVEDGRATILGEFGGLGLPLEDHLWWNKRNWGYRTYRTRPELNDRYADVMHNLWGPYARGVSAAIYTQTTDVEGEVNGLMTYDRRVVKFSPRRLNEIHSRYYDNDPEGFRVVLAASHERNQSWKYTTRSPVQAWRGAGFDDARWQTGEAPFRGEPDAVGFPNGSDWTSERLWARKTFRVDEIPENLWLEILHQTNEGAVYLNGTRISRLEGRTRHEYRHEDVSQHRDLLRVGENVIAVELESEYAERSFDLGLYALE